jgi:hypothetical protein
MNHPITPPSELVKQWLAEPECVSGWNGKCTMISVTDHRFSNICAKAAQWGADQELEACCEWTAIVGGAEALRATRRSKPPSAVAQAETLIERHEDGWVPSPAQWHTIREGLAEGRRALEALDD